MQENNDQEIENEDLYEHHKFTASEGQEPLLKTSSAMTQHRPPNAQPRPVQLYQPSSTYHGHSHS
jgi:hypothetical protein